MYKFLLRRKIKKIIEQSNRKKAYRNLKEIKSILILFDTKNFDEANHFIQQLKDMDKRVKAFAFKDKKDTNKYSNISYTIVTEKDMIGESLMQVTNSLSDEKIDLVVDFTLKENLLLLYILVSVKSPFKVGFYKHELSVHDIVVSYTSERVNLKELGQQLMHYLAEISSGAENNG